MICTRLYFQLTRQQFEVMVLTPFLFVIIYQASLMKRSIFLQDPNTAPPTIQDVPSQQFFSLKRKTKRMKVSLCFSEPAIQPEPITLSRHGPLAQSVNIEDDHKLSKELDSTFGGEQVLAFKSRPLRRKRNANYRPSKPALQEESQESDNEQPVSRCKQKEEKHKQTSESWTLDRFILLGRLGRGTYSEVVLAVDRQTGFVCALKVLEKERMKAMGVGQNLLREIKINMCLRHPNIAQLYGCFSDQTHLYLICEYATDHNLFDTMLQSQQLLPVSQVVGIVGQVCAAVEHFHSQEVMHRDIKPQNILLTMGGTVKLCDFGWAVHSSQTQLRATFCGTPLYLAPELVSQNPYDHSVDIWAIGILTYEMITRSNPFKITQPQHLRNIVKQQVSFQGMDNPLAIDFIKSALEKDPNQRSNARQLKNHPFLLG